MLSPGNVVVELMFYKIALLSLLSYHENIKNKTKLSYTVIMVVNISTTMYETNNQLPPLTTSTKKTTAYMSLEIQVLAWNRRIMWLS